MPGIISCGSYVPLWRMNLQRAGGSQRGERAIANFDEDSLTMGIAAAANCLRGIDRSTVDGLFFATTTSPYHEKQISVLAAAALDLREDIVASDFSNSLRAGTSALRSALDSAKAGTAKRVLVIAADMRPAIPGSELEAVFGDGAAALLVGADDVRAEVRDGYSICREIIDSWRSEDDRFVRSWEDRFVVEEGYFKALPAAVAALLKRNGLTPKEFSKAAFYAPDARRHREMTRLLGFGEVQAQDPMFGRLGDTGAALSLMVLVAALEEASPGDRVLLGSYGNGADAFILEVRGKLANGRTVKAYLDSKKEQKDYSTYLRWRGILDMPSRGHSRQVLVPSASAILREEEKNTRFHGVKCRQCGAIQYPPQRVCIKCQSKDKFEKYPFWDKKAELFTYSEDLGTPSPDPPYVLAIVNFEGGGRIWMNMTDKDVNELKIGIPLETAFRRLATVEGIHNYYWKCLPVRI